MMQTVFSSPSAVRALLIIMSCFSFQLLMIKGIPGHLSVVVVGIGANIEFSTSSFMMEAMRAPLEIVITCQIKMRHLD